MMRKHWRRFIIRLRRAMLKHLVEERTKQYLRDRKEARERTEHYRKANVYTDVSLLIEMDYNFRGGKYETYKTN